MAHIEKYKHRNTVIWSLVSHREIQQKQQRSLLSTAKKDMILAANDTD